MKILYIGESWLGSCARSLKEALSRRSGVTLEEVNEDIIIPKPRGRLLRALNRVIGPAYRRELFDRINERLDQFSPDVLMVYKGYPLSADSVRSLRERGVFMVNVYPDNSPLAYGASHRQAVGEYHLVISTKPFHPGLWSDAYGYKNECRFVPQGYDPLLHLITEPVRNPRFDVVMVATWRPEYGALMESFARALGGRKVKVGIAGNGWIGHRRCYPSDWVFGGERQGRAYVDWLRQGNIAIAPLSREVVIDGQRQPGDEDSTRTYEVAASHCFFVHRRTEYVKSLYDETTETPMFDTPEELAEKVLFYLDHPEVREQMAAAAHRRAVPAYSLDARAEEIVTLLSERIEGERL